MGLSEEMQKYGVDIGTLVGRYARYKKTLEVISNLGCDFVDVGDECADSDEAYPAGWCPSCIASRELAA